MYQWKSPRNWLLDQVNTGEDIEALRQIAWVLAHNLDSDTIQNLFAEEMDEDGYFEEAE